MSSSTIDCSKSLMNIHPTLLSMSVNFFTSLFNKELFKASCIVLFVFSLKFGDRKINNQVINNSYSSTSRAKSIKTSSAAPAILMLG